jgi:hypothetical protein
MSTHVRLNERASQLLAHLTAQTGQKQSALIEEALLAFARSARRLQVKAAAEQSPWDETDRDPDLYEAGLAQLNTRTDGEKP